MKRDLRSMGSLDVSGGVYDIISVMGGFTVSNDIAFRFAKVMGCCNCGGNLSGDRIRFLGGCAIQGEVRVKHQRIIGAITSTGSLIGEVLYIHGTVTAPTINCDRLRLYTSDDCQVGAIGAGVVRINQRHMFSSGRKMGILTVDTIEADEIAVRNVAARRIQGDRIRIGPGCDVAEVEYTQSLDIDSSAKIGKRIKI